MMRFVVTTCSIQLISHPENANRDLKQTRTGSLMTALTLLRD